MIVHYYIIKYLLNIIYYIMFFTWKSIRTGFAKDVSNTRTGSNFDASSALPNPKAHLEVFPSPNVHLFVIGADFIEETSVNGEQTSGHHRRWIRLNLECMEI